MIKTLAKQIKEFKAASIATPLFMILEVLMEMIIPYLMASIIDKGVNTGISTTSTKSAESWLLRRSSDYSPE